MKIEHTNRKNVREQKSDIIKKKVKKNMKKKKKENQRVRQQ